eukprot:scaffold141096_cov24-Tisochrysis_lutea.AAC.1
MFRQRPFHSNHYRSSGHLSPAPPASARPRWPARRPTRLQGGGRLGLRTDPLNNLPQSRDCQRVAGAYLGAHRGTIRKASRMGGREGVTLVGRPRTRNLHHL